MNKNTGLIKPDFLILDGLRGIASVYVVLNHCRGNLLMGGSEFSKIAPVSQWSIATKLYYLLLQFTSLGREFVIFFFVLSGFSIAYSLSKNNQVLAFYKRRLIRLYPPYILALIWAAFIFFIVTKFAPVQLKPEMKSVFNNFTYVICNIFYIPKGDLIAPFWSLTHEVIFYVLIPFFYLKRLHYYVIFSLIGYFLGYVINWNGTELGSIIGQFLLDYNIYFALGILLYTNFSKAKSIFVMRKAIFGCTICFALILMIIIKLYFGIDNKISLIISAFLSVIMIINFLHYEICSKLLEFFGKMSYTIYITHFASMYLFIVIVNKFIPTYHTDIMEWYVWILGVIFCLLFAVPLYYLAEYPSKKVLQSIRKHHG
ncbi:MAG: hypothetical protein JWQ79_3618 [Mucilaginibacter sp.]|nr:hypothetical protein [Mucilaginibacter sp.]